MFEVERKERWLRAKSRSPERNLEYRTKERSQKLEKSDRIRRRRNSNEKENERKETNSRRFSNERGNHADTDEEVEEKHKENIKKSKVSSLDKRRKGHFIIATKLMEKIEDELQESEPNVIRIEIKLAELKRKREKISSIDEEMIDALSDDEGDPEVLDKEIESASDRQEEIETCIALAETFLQEQRNDGSKNRKSRGDESFRRRSKSQEDFRSNRNDDEDDGSRSRRRKEDRDEDEDDGSRSRRRSRRRKEDREGYSDEDERDEDYFDRRRKSQHLSRAQSSSSVSKLEVEGTSRRNSISRRNSFAESERRKELQAEHAKLIREKEKLAIQSRNKVRRKNKSDCCII